MDKQIKNASDMLPDPDWSEFFSVVSGKSQMTGLAFINDALRTLEGSPDIQLDWNEEMQIHAKEGIIAAIKILADAGVATDSAQTSGWAGVESAPKDGRWFMTCHSGSGNVREIRWSKPFGSWIDGSALPHKDLKFDLCKYATHWIDKPNRCIHCNND